MTAPPDPVMQRRKRLSRLASFGRRGGYLLYALSLVVFFAGLITGFNDTLASVTAIGLVAGSVLLAPAIIIGYGVRAADRADRDSTW